MKPASLAQRMRRRAVDFARDEGGMSVLAEFVIYFPLLVWAWLALFAFWDAYRQINIAQKATFAITDMISREQTAISNNYRDGLRNVFAYMAGVSNSDVKVRFTSVKYTIDNAQTQAGSFKKDWSYSPGGAMPQLTTNDIQQKYGNEIPMMADGQYVLMIETMMEYEPAIKIPVLLDTREIKNFVIIKPRFVRVCEAGQTCT